MTKSEEDKIYREFAIALWDELKDWTYEELEAYYKLLKFLAALKNVEAENE